MGFPIKKRITPLMQTINGGCEGASGLDILSAAINSSLLQHREITYPSPFVTKSADLEVTNGERICDEESITSSTLSTTPSVTSKEASSQQRRRVVAASSPHHSIKRNKRSRTFPDILMGILSSPDYAHIIGWSSSGRSFVIHDTALFSSQILPKYFRRVVFRSFVRKLNRWGFRSMRRSSEEGRIESNYSAPRFEHKHFSRDEPEMCARIFCKSNPVVSKRIPPAKLVDGPGSGDDMSHAGDDGLPGGTGTNNAVVISPIVSVASILSAGPVATATTVVPHPQPRQLQTTGGIGLLVPPSVSTHQRRNEEFRTFSTDCIFMDLQVRRLLHQRRHQALMNQMCMMQISSEADALSQVIAEKWQEMMLLNGGFR